MPIVYEVDRIRDGKSFTTRRVVAIQHGRAIFSMSVSFHNDEPGLDHQMTMPDVPHPDALPSDAEIKQKILPQLPEAVRRYYERERPIELRPVDFGRYAGKPQPDNRFNIWMRTTAPLPDDPAIHRCALAYASDMTILDTALLPHQRSVFDRDIMGASLDHALWFHRPFRADQWLLYTPGQPEPARLPRLRPRPDLRRRRHAGRLGRPGGPAARAASRAQTGLNCPRPRAFACG